MSGAAVRTAYRLNVSKTKFYKLAKSLFPEIGPMKSAAFFHEAVYQYTDTDRVENDKQGDSPRFELSHC